MFVDMLRKFALLWLSCASIVGCGTITEGLPSYEESSVVVVGDHAPDFTASTLSGESVTLSALQGEEVLLVLFSHECSDCKMLLDDMQTAKVEFEELGVCVLLVARDGEAGDVATYMSENGYEFDVVADPDRAIYNLYATTYVPRTYLLDKEGVVVHTTIEYDASCVEQILSNIQP
jgi:peroxiredoxin